MVDDLKDYFSAVSTYYANNRPTYPPAMFDWLASQCRAHDLAWDCGAGSGQASTELGRIFKCVLATDISAAQISQADWHPRVEYRQARADRSGLDDCSVDLVVVAQALHWFDLGPFYMEVRRVLKPTGVIAVWSYGILQVADATVNDLVQRFYYNDVGPYWPPERHHVENGYRELAFPFCPVETPAFVMSLSWNMAQLLGYFRSWSATECYIQAKGIDPVAQLELSLRTCWGDANCCRDVQWPLTLRVGRMD